MLTVAFWTGPPPLSRTTMVSFAVRPMRSVPCDSICSHGITVGVGTAVAVGLGDGVGVGVAVGGASAGTLIFHAPRPLVKAKSWLPSLLGMSWKIQGAAGRLVPRTCQAEPESYE